MIFKGARAKCVKRLRLNKNMPEPVHYGNRRYTESFLVQETNGWLVKV